jgi:hypothetical protein
MFTTLSFLVFAAAAAVSAEGLMIMAGWRRDIEGGAAFVAIYIGFPAFCVGLALAAADLLVAVSRREPGAVLWLSGTAAALNVVPVCFWTVLVVRSVLSP